MKYSLILWILFLSSNLFAAERFISPLPLRLGEKLVFSVKVLGAYIGDQTLTVDKIVDYNGKKVVEGWGTSVSKRKVYYLNDKEMTYFDPVTLDPLYNERWVHQGDWVDRMWFNFFPDLQQVIYIHNKGGNKKNTIQYQGRMNSFYTMIAYLRSLDYEWYLTKKKPIEFNYLFGIYLKHAVFKCTATTIRYKGNNVPAVLVKEINGMGYQFIILLNEDRLPFKLVIPGDSLSFVIYLKDFTRGSALISEGLN